MMWSMYMTEVVEYKRKDVEIVKGYKECLLIVMAFLGVFNVDAPGQQDRPGQG